MEEKHLKASSLTTRQPMEGREREMQTHFIDNSCNFYNIFQFDLGGLQNILNIITKKRARHHHRHHYCSPSFHHRHYHHHEHYHHPYHHNSSKNIKMASAWCYIALGSMGWANFIATDLMPNNIFVPKFQAMESMDKARLSYKGS